MRLLSTNGILLFLLICATKSATGTSSACFTVTRSGGPGETRTLHFPLLFAFFAAGLEAGVASFFTDSCGRDFSEEDSCLCCLFICGCETRGAPGCAELPPALVLTDEGCCGAAGAAVEPPGKLDDGAPDCDWLP